MDDILIYFPEKIKEELFIFFRSQKEYSFENLEEIRIRTSKYIILKFNKEEKILRYIVHSNEVLEILQKICENSIYSYQNQITSGYITIKGGHRVGISGSVVIEDNKVININYIYSLNFRIAKQILGSGNRIIEYILDKENNTVYNTLIISPPRIWKNNNFERFNKTN